MYVAGAGMLGAIEQITREGSGTVLSFTCALPFRRAAFKVRRKTAGQSTIHVPAGCARLS